MAQHYHIAFAPPPKTSCHKCHFAVLEAGEFGLRKVGIAICRTRVSIHRKYLYRTAILQAQFTKRLSYYPAYFFNTTGGREDAEGEEEDFGRQNEMLVLSS